MTIEAGWLREAVELVTGEVCEVAEAARLAGVLGVTEEVLPWLALRRGAFADWPQGEDCLTRQAARRTSPETRRAPASSLSRDVLAARRDAEDVLRQIIAENVERAALGEEAGLLLKRWNEAEPLAAGYRFVRHIA